MKAQCHLILEPVGPVRADVALPPRTRRSSSARSLCSSCAPASLEGSAATRILLDYSSAEKLLRFIMNHNYNVWHCAWFDTFKAEVGCGLDLAGDDTKRGIFDGFWEGLLKTAAAIGWGCCCSASSGGMSESMFSYSLAWPFDLKRGWMEQSVDLCSFPMRNFNGRKWMKQRSTL